MDGCLVIDNTIVVWPVDRIDEAAEAIAAVKAGESPQLLIGGGGISLDEGARPDQFPTAITERCQTTAVWFVAGEGETASDMPPILSSEGIDPDECNLIHNITACDQDEFDRLGEDSSLPMNPDTGATDASCEPVPLRSDCDIDPNECNQIHNIDACGEILNPPDLFDEPAGEGGDYFQVTIRFNTSYTQEDIDEVDALLRTYDDDFEFIILESFPPIGSALLTLETSDECWTIEAQLEAKSYVADASCEPRQPVHLDDPDAPVPNPPTVD